MASSPPTLPSIESLSAATDDDTLKSVLDTLFEPSPELHALSIPSIRDELSKPSHGNSFTYATLIEHIGALLLTLTSSPSSSTSPSQPSHNPTLYAILGSHPRLGAKKVTSAQSRAEQAQLNNSTNPSPATTTTTAPSSQTDDLTLLNAEYEARFPGLRYVVFVNGRGREAIAEDARTRIARGDVVAEEREIVRAMVDIARDRAGKLGVVL